MREFTRLSLASRAGPELLATPANALPLRCARVCLQQLRARRAQLLAAAAMAESGGINLGALSLEQLNQLRQSIEEVRRLPRRRPV